MASKRTTNLFILAIGVVAAIAGIVVSNQKAEQQLAVGQPPAVPEATPAQLRVGDLMPDFSLPDLSGRMRGKADWAGKVVVVNFWATWCPPCLAEIPMFVGYQKTHAQQGLQFVGVAVDDPERVREFVKERDMNYPVLLGQDDGAALSRQFGNHLGALPFTVVFDRNGKARHLVAGQLEAEQVESLILSLL